MLYHQKVKLKGVNISNVIKSFHDRKFVEFLISLQPVKINSWDGIENGMEASFSFWFFGWRNMKVIHDNYESSETHLHFEDIGLELPFGLSNWHHHHIVQAYEDGVVITDKIKLESKNYLKMYLVYPIMVFPILARRISYRIWFYKRG
tara:strand:+ start:97 stop:540 length:444 start_codon:yes stop_codon:yes gene_type:complete